MPLDERIIPDLREAFNEHAINGVVTKQKLGDVFQSAGEPIPAFKLREMFENVTELNFDEFLNLFEKMDLSTSWGAKLRENVQSKSGLIQISGSNQSATGTVHSMSDAECKSFSNFMNRLLRDDPDCKKYLPIDPNTHELFSKVNDGILLCKLINCAVPQTIDERAINKTKLNKFTINENLNLAINSSSSVGCHVVNIGATEIAEGRPHLILGLVWQLIRIRLLSAINLKSNPNLVCLLNEGETIEDFMALGPEDILLRWVNYQLIKSGSGCSKTMYNFHSDLKDSEIYSHLMDAVVPGDMMKYDHNAILSKASNEEKADMVVDNAFNCECPGLVSANDIVHGNQKLNMAFIADLFNTFPNLEPAEEELIIEETREEKTYRNWMNSLGIKPQVNWIYTDLSDGIVLLKLHDIINPGSVDWKKVTKPPFKGPSAKIKKIENCNQVIELGRKVKLSLVGIAGQDIHDGTKTLCLANLWQMMRLYTLKVLQDISNSDKPITDNEIVQWANSKTAGSGIQISGFKDSSLVTSHPILTLIDSIKPESVNKSYIKPGSDNEEKLLNAQYAVSMARKIGAKVYALPEDIVEGNFKMVMTIYACLMARGLQNG